MSNEEIEEAATEWGIAIIAKTAHEVNRAYCLSIGDSSQLSWSKASYWQQESAIDGVRFIMNNMNATPEDSHRNWMKEKSSKGWVYGDVKDENKKTHPCIIRYEELPKEQRSKEYIYQALVKNLIEELDINEQN